MRPDVAVVIATAGARPEMLATELESIGAAFLYAKRAGVRCEVIVETDTERRGVAATLAAGLERTDARFTTFWGDDDYMLPEYIDAHLAVAAEGYDVVSGSMILADGNLERLGVRILPPPIIGDLLANNITVNDGALVRAETRLPLRPERGRAMMMGWWLDMLAAGRRFGTVTTPTWLYRQHEGQLSASWSPDEMALRWHTIREHLDA